MKKKFFAVIAVLCAMMCLMCGVTAYASGPSKISWLQATNPTFGGAMNDYLAPVSAVVFEGVATSSSSGTFKAKLQRKSGLFWSDVGGTVYTISQHSNQTYSSRLGTYVTGQYFKVQWSVNTSGDYRVYLYDPSSPQSTVLQYVYLYSK